jgi:hypothetical protein
MPKKKKDDAPTAPLPAIDHAYVQALKIQTLVRCLPPLHMFFSYHGTDDRGGARPRSPTCAASASSSDDRLPHDQEERNQTRNPKTLYPKRETLKPKP